MWFNMWEEGNNVLIFWCRSCFRGYFLNLGILFKKNVIFIKFGNGLFYLIYFKLIEYLEL